MAVYPIKKQSYETLYPISVSIALHAGISQHPGAKKSSAKPLLFKEYPNTINCTEEQLASLFTYGNDAEVTLLLPNGLTLKGPVRWYARKYSNLQTVSIKLTEFSNTLFSVSRRFDAANNFIYVAHMFNPDFADGYELEHKEGSSYQLVKMDTNKIIQICSR